LGVVPVPQTKVHVEPLEGLRSTVNSTSESFVGLSGACTEVHETCAVPKVGLVAVTTGSVRVDTAPLAEPLPLDVQYARAPIPTMDATDSRDASVSRLGVK
jgi:hypothetical protein